MAARPASQLMAAFLAGVAILAMVATYITHQLRYGDRLGLRAARAENAARWQTNR